MKIRTLATSFLVLAAIAGASVRVGRREPAGGSAGGWSVRDQYGRSPFTVIRRIRRVWPA